MSDLQVRTRRTNGGPNEFETEVLIDDQLVSIHRAECATITPVERQVIIDALLVEFVRENRRLMELAKRMVN